MVASFDKAILPGQEGKITLKVNTASRRGRVSKGAYVFSNDPQQPKTRITLSCKIKQYISVEPNIRVNLSGYWGDKIEKKVTITALEEKPLKITDITTTIENKIKYKLKTIEKDEKYSLEIKTRSGLKESFRGKVVLKTNSQRKPELTFYVTCDLRKEVKVSPGYLFFGIIDTSKEAIDPKNLERTAVVNRVKGGSLTIEKIEPVADWINVEAEINKEGKEHRVVITLDKDKSTKGKFREKVTIHTR